jgi:TolB-like protein/tetratricopeptide (TPR) repeat protein/predicted Ser/Thr protein kinase
MIGQTVSHYRILDRLGRGGMGEVYLAEDLSLHRQVALKIPAGDDSGRLVREARAASAIAHPQVAVIYEIGDWEDGGHKRPFIAMEYVPGRTLARLLEEGALPTEETLRIAGQIVEALSAAHAQGVVHRDVKPSNVMVGEDGRVKVLDFGLAKHVPFVGESLDTWSREEGSAGSLGALVGTAAYMSPEQVRGLEVDARTDVFSLGVLLYEMLARHRPFEGENAAAVLGAILHARPVSLDRLERGVSPALAAVVDKMLAKERDARYASMGEVRDALALGSIGAFAGSAAAAVPSVAAIRFSNITANEEDDWLGTGIAETLITDLKGQSGFSIVSRERTTEVLRKLGAFGVPEDSLAASLGREVGARFVVGGAYQRQGDGVRVTVRITEMPGGVVAGSFKVDGRMNEVFALQDRIASGVASLLRVSAPATAAHEDTGVVEAFAAYSRGLIELRQESALSIDRAIQAFARAAILDPDYAKAHMQLGIAQAVKAGYLSQADLFAPAVARLRRALELEPTLTEAWRELGSTLVQAGQVDEGIAAIERALVLDPTDASSHSSLGRAHFIGKGDFEQGARCYERALALNPQAGWSALQLAHCSAFLGDFPRGEGAALRAIVLQEEFLSGKEGIVIVGAYIRLGHLYALQGRHGEARREFDREMEFLGRTFHALKARVVIELHARLGASLLALGEEKDARSALDFAVESFERRNRISGGDPFTRYYGAGAYALRGDEDAALLELERAAAEFRAYTVARARIDPFFESLRGAPRFQAMVTSLAR